MRAIERLPDCTAFWIFCFPSPSPLRLQESAECGYDGQNAINEAPLLSRTRQRARLIVTPLIPFEQPLLFDHFVFFAWIVTSQLLIHRHFYHHFHCHFHRAASSPVDFLLR